MRLVLITRDGPEHRYLANRIDREVGLSAIVVDEGLPKSRGKRLKQLWRRYSVPQLGGRILLAILKKLWRDPQKREQELLRVLGQDSIAFNRPEILVKVQGVNKPPAIETLKALDANRLLIYGTGIISDRVLELSPEVPLNMHTGISPHYRGASCAFWPLHEDDLDLLGATVHEVTSKVDGGNIYSVGQAELEPQDTVHSVFGQCVVSGTEQYIAVLEELEGGEAPHHPQEGQVGREFRASMRGLMAEWRVRSAIRKGQVRRWCQNRQESGVRGGEA